MDYSTYWSVLDTPLKSIQSNTVCLCIAIGSGLLWFLVKKFKKDKDDSDKTIILWATGSFAILGLASSILLTFFYPDKSSEQTLKMLNSPTTLKVEGVVSNFERTYRNGKETIEKFTVDSVQFAYSDALISKLCSFSQTYNNIIFDGQKVRVTYKSDSPYCNNCNSILKLEIAR
jgi:hypothetical protein